MDSCDIATFSSNVEAQNNWIVKKIPEKTRGGIFLTRLNLIRLISVSGESTEDNLEYIRLILTKAEINGCKSEELFFVVTLSLVFSSVFSFQFL